MALRERVVAVKAPEPDGRAAVCKTAEAGSTPAGASHRLPLVRSRCSRARTLRLPAQSRGIDGVEAVAERVVVGVDRHRLLPPVAVQPELVVDAILAAHDGRYPGRWAARSRTTAQVSRPERPWQQ